MKITQITEGPCDVAKPEEIEKMSGVEYDKYAQWKKDCEAEERTTPLSTKRLESEETVKEFDGDPQTDMSDLGRKYHNINTNGINSKPDKFLQKRLDIKRKNTHRKGVAYVDPVFGSQSGTGGSLGHKGVDKVDLTYTGIPAKRGGHKSVSKFYPTDKKILKPVSTNAPIKGPHTNTSNRWAESTESYDDYHGDMSKEEYDKTVNDSEMEYTVWVGGTEANDNWLSYDEAVALYDKYKAQGYDDVQLDARIKQEIPQDIPMGIRPYPKGVTEKAKPDFLDLDKDGDKKEPMKKAGKTKKEVCAKEAYNPETGRDPNVDTTEWDNLIAKAKKKQGISDEEVYFNYGDIGGNIIVNPKSTIEDQIFELLNRYYDISAMEFDPSKIEIQETQLKSENEFSKKVKEATDADAAAIKDRDDFIKMVSARPKSSNKAIDTIKKIVADKQNMQVKFDDGKMKVDLYTASAVSAVYDALKPETQEKVDNMLRTKEGMLKLSNFAFSKLNEAIHEGRLDEWAFVPAIGRAVVGGVAKVAGSGAARVAGNVVKANAIGNMVKDKLGKEHDANSPQGKMITNMKKKDDDDNNKDKDGDGKDDEKELERQLAQASKDVKAADRAANIKSGMNAVGRAAKVGGGMLSKMATSSGFGNPLSASKYSPEDKSIEMMKEAMDKANSK